MQVINTPTLTLPHQGGGNFSLHPLFSPPLVGGGWGEGDKKRNSYTIKLAPAKNTLPYSFDERLRSWPGWQCAGRSQNRPGAITIIHPLAIFRDGRGGRNTKYLQTICDNESQKKRSISRSDPRGTRASFWRVQRIAARACFQTLRHPADRNYACYF